MKSSNPAPWSLPMFAYGVNTNVEHLSRRCPTWDGTRCPALLPDHVMRFEKAYPGSTNSYCNIREQPGSEVYGLLLWLDAESFRSIDGYEGFPIHYQRRLVTVQTGRYGKQTAWAYHSRHVDPTLAPTVGYYTNVMRGLSDCGAPDWYLADLEASVSRLNCELM